MISLDRRKFLSLVPAPLLSLGVISPVTSLLRISSSAKRTQDYATSPVKAESCWLDVCAPFIVEDAPRGIHSEIILTSDTFAGSRGYEDQVDQTEYELYLYDPEGRPIGANGVARRLTVPAMTATIINASDLLEGQKSFWGGLRIRLRPKGREVMHASDLFSSAFVRWSSGDSFDNVHANPDPLQWQKPEAFCYSMPFPSLTEYECAFSLFNPYDARSMGAIVMHEHGGRKLIEMPYDLPAHASLIIRLNAGDLVRDAARLFSAPISDSKTRRLTDGGGMIKVNNAQGSQKSFGYLLIRKPDRPRFSIDHPIHQSVYRPAPMTRPFDSQGRFVAKNVLYSPLLFRAKRFGDLTLESRFHFCTGLPLEEALWLSLFATDAAGNVPWLSASDPKLAGSIAPTPVENGVIKLNIEQSCVLDFARLSLSKDFSGGLSLALAPDSTHTLMKVEINVPEWGAHAFTHFRPGIRAARSYQKPKQRGSLVTDYISSGARLQWRNGKRLFDEIVAVMNIDDRNIQGNPRLELFDARGFIRRVELETIPGFATRHYLLSELIKAPVEPATLTLRLVDEQASLLMSTIHLDYTRRDIALDHGSDRFSTFVDYGCSTTA